MTELEIFEQITGVKFTPEFLKCQKKENIDLRDIFVWLTLDIFKKSDYERVAKLIGKDRTSIYGSIIRFYNRHFTDKNYREIANKINNEFIELTLKQKL